MINAKIDKVSENKFDVLNYIVFEDQQIVGRRHQYFQ